MDKLTYRILAYHDFLFTIYLDIYYGLKKFKLNTKVYKSHPIKTQNGRFITLYSTDEVKIFTVEYDK